MEKSILRGRVRIPGSKSHTIRAVVLASLADGESEIISPLESADTAAAVRCYSGLGARIECGQTVPQASRLQLQGGLETQIECGQTWRIQGVGGQPRPPENVIDVGNSGTTLRFGLGSAALLQEGTAVITGDEQIRARPLGPLIKSINDLGGQCYSTRDNGKSPIVVRGRLKGGRTEIEAITSQYLSSLLINAPLADGDSVIDVIKLNEQPYVEMTLKYLDEQNIRYKRQGWSRFEIEGRQQYKPFRKRIPADFSSATFFLCAGAILEGELVLEGLDFSDTQGDKAVVEILKNMGVDIEIGDGELTVRRGELRGIDIDLNATPDALPALAVVGCFAKGKTRLYNVPQARLKETDRIAVMAAELGRMGAQIKELPDGLMIEQSTLRPGRLNGHSDHRVVMALSLTAMALEGESSIDTAEAVAVTFPNYVELMQSVGGRISVENVVL